MRTATLLAILAFVSLTGCSGGSDGAEGTLSGAASGDEAVTLKAHVEAVVTSPTTAVLRVTNTTSPDASTVPDAPVLTRFQFNSPAGIPASCVSVAPADPGWGVDDVKPLCGVGSPGTGPEPKPEPKPEPEPEPEPCECDCWDGCHDHDWDEPCKGDDWHDDCDDGECKDDDWHDDCDDGECKDDDWHDDCDEDCDDDDCDGECKDDDKGKKDKKGKKNKEKGKKKGKLEVTVAGFDHAVAAHEPAPHNGLSPGEVLEIQLHLDPACGVTFDAASFADAKVVDADGTPVHWGARLQVVGDNGHDSGCALGLYGAGCEPDFRWSEIIATAADTNGLPSLFMQSDSRAGSLEINVNGGWSGFDGLSDDRPYEAAIVTMRNGADQIVEQLLVNRVNTPAALDENGCSLDKPYPSCWLFAPLDLTGEDLVALLPVTTEGSNAGFDPSGDRARVDGGLVMHYGEDGPFTNNRHETMQITWTAPLGLETAQILLRARYDDEHDGLDDDDPLVTLLRLHDPNAEDTIAAGVQIVHSDTTSLTIRMTAEQALERVCESYEHHPAPVSVVLVE